MSQPLPPEKQLRTVWRSLPRNVWAVSLTSFFMDISSEMVINLLPLFMAVCEHARCSPEQLMYVGDSLETEVFGVRGVGAVSEWLNGDRRRKTTNIVLE